MDVQPRLPVDRAVGNPTLQGELCRPTVTSRHDHQAACGAVEVGDALAGQRTHSHLLGHVVGLAAVQT